MNLKDQVLSLGQVRELKKLGFDVRKHSSMCYLPYYYSSLYKIDGYTLDTIERNDSFNSIPTMTIGDIIEVLPQRITMNNTGYILKTLHKFDISYTDCAGRKLNAFNLSLETLNLIDALFETLKWCIINKNI